MKKIQAPFIFLSCFLYYLFLISNSFAEFRDVEYEKCNLSKDSFDKVLREVENKNPNAISSLAGCLKMNHKLIFQACLIDVSQLEKAEDIFRDNEGFVIRLMKINKETLKYASKRLRSDKFFVERATYIHRDSLQYADEKLLDNIIFMRKMIKNDSRNYMFASNRIKSSFEHAKLAFEDNGELLLYAPEEIINNKKLVKIALKSSTESFNFINTKLQKDEGIKKIYQKRRSDFSKEKLEDFLKEKYLITDEKDNVGKKIDETSQIYKDNFLVNRKYVVKWHKKLKLENYHLKQKWRLIEAKNRNYPTFWQDDFKDYPELIEKIQEFFTKRLMDKETIDNLKTTYLLKAQDNPLTFAFNLYMLRPNNDDDLGEKYVNTTSLTAIAVKSENDWKLTVIEVIFDNDIKTDIAYKKGHKKYIAQDLYFENEKDKNPKIIFKVEDYLNEYFEVYGQSSGDKYHIIYRLDPLNIKGSTDYSDDPFHIIRGREEQEEYEYDKMMENCRRNIKCARKINDLSFFEE